MSLGGLSGLASGVDTSSIVEQLITFERRSTKRLTLRQSAITARQTALKDIATKLNALKAASQDLSSAATWGAKQAVESSDPTRVAVALTGGAGIGGHSIQVDRLASSAEHRYAFTSSATAGTIDLAYANDPASKVTIDIKAGATAADIATAINSKGSAPAFASVVDDPLTGEQRLVLSARKTGSDSDFTLDTSNLPDAVFGETSSRTGNDLNAAYRIDGSATALYAKTNVIDNLLPGVKVTLKGITTQPVSVNVAEPAIDQTAVKTKVKAFVDAYNAVVTAARAKVTERSVANASTSADAGKGQLFGDTGLLSMLSSLRVRMGERLGALTTSNGLDELADLGIAIPKATGTASQDAKDGKLAIDEAKLTEVLTADSSKVKTLFAAFGADLEKFIKTQAGTGSILASRDKAADAELRMLNDQLTRTNDRIDAKEKRLKAQFAAMESALQNTQSQTAWLQGQIAALG